MDMDWTGAFLEWKDELDRLKDRIASVFLRPQTHATAGDFLNGLLSGVERKTGWMMAEQAGLAKPYRMQSLIGRSHWSADALRDIVRDYVLESLGEDDGVLVVDETGFVKKGEHSVGVARQYSGAAGRIENSQVGVFLGYASRRGQALIDRRLYLPKEWAADVERRREASVPDDVVFATKNIQAREMIAAALDGGARCRWVLADAGYGGDSALRMMLEDRRQSYALAIRSNQTLRMLWQKELIQTDPAWLASQLAPSEWQKLAAGEGAKGIRFYDWARIALSRTSDGFGRWLLFRRSLSEPDKIAFYFAFATEETSLAVMAGAAGTRWTIEECFERAKSELGLDHCEARSWHAWHRHMTLVMTAAAFLAKLEAGLRKPVDSRKQNETSLKRLRAA